MNAPSFDSKSLRKRRIMFQIKKVSALLLLFVGLFTLSFYAVNLFEVKPTIKKAPLTAVSVSDLEDADEQLKSKMGSSNASLAGFSDWAVANNLSGENIYEADPDKEGLANYLEYIHGTDPSNADTDGDKYSDKQEITNGYDPDAYGDVMTGVSISIEKLGVSAPMVWSKTDVEQSMLKELENGVAHFVGTASPGQSGNAVISGHSSNYIWAKGAFNYVFKNLNDLEAGDTVTVSTIQKNGRIITYKYKVNDKYVTTPDDERIFEETSNSTLTLSTCWPLGTNFKRVIVKAEII